jgi:hypothetical protein
LKEVAIWSFKESLTILRVAGFGQKNAGCGQKNAGCGQKNAGCGLTRLRAAGLVAGLTNFKKNIVKM